MDDLYYTLDADGNPIPADLETYHRDHLDMTFRRVGVDQVGESEVSTVFLGINHCHNPTGEPVLWETMVFGGPLDGEQERYCTLAAARAGHANWLARVTEAAKGA